MKDFFLLSNGFIVTGEQNAIRSGLSYEKICDQDTREILNLMEFKRQLLLKQENKPRPFDKRSIV